MLARRLILPLIGVGLAACATPPNEGTAVGVYTYADNRLSREYAASIDRIREATVRALDRLGLPREDLRVDFQSFSVHSETAGEDPVLIRGNRQASGRTILDVRVGDAASETRRGAAEIIHEEVRRRLERSPDPAPNAAP